MDLKTAGDWLTWGGLVVPLCVLAWSGWEYLRIQKSLARQRDFENFFNTLGRIQNNQRSAILQRAAVFELRNYPQYRELILRLCDQAEATFSGQSDMQYHLNQLMEEFRLTSENMKDSK